MVSMVSTLELMFLKLASGRFFQSLKIPSPVAEGAAIQRSNLVVVLFEFYWELNGLAEKARFLAEVHLRFRTTTQIPEALSSACSCRPEGTGFSYSLL